MVALRRMWAVGRDVGVKENDGITLGGEKNRGLVCVCWGGSWRGSRHI